MTIGKGGLVNVKETDKTSARLTALNEGVVDGTPSSVAFNYHYEGSTIKSEDGSYDEYYVYVFEYDHSVFNYTLSASYDLEAEDKDDVEIPTDGFVLAVHSSFKDILANLNAAPEGAKYYPHGFRATDELDTTIKQKTPTIDGKVDANEYGQAIWSINPESELCSYEQFEVNNYYSTAEVYATYDKDNLYLAVVVNSQFHDCKLANNATDRQKMYSYESIQVNVTASDPEGEYMVEHWNGHTDSEPAKTNILRQYGFCVNEEGESLWYVWCGAKTGIDDGVFNGKTVNTRDDGAQLTVYEVSIPWSEIGDPEKPIDPKKGLKLGLSVSINSGNNTFKNIFLRDGGGIIGLNDWTKVPTVTLD